MVGFRRRNTKHYIHMVDDDDKTPFIMVYCKAIRITSNVFAKEIKTLINEALENMPPTKNQSIVVNQMDVCVVTI